MKKLLVCLLVASVLTDCGMSAQQRLALQEAENRATQLRIQQQREWAEQQRRSQLTPDQRHAEDLAKIKVEQEQYRALGTVGGAVICAMFGC